MTNANSALISFSPIALQFTGAILSILGGFLALLLRSRMEKRQEIKYIKISITDELAAICDTVKRMSETHKVSHIVSNVYINELDKNTESYNFHKQRLFIINNQELRISITTFYKELSTSLNDARNQVGTLGEKPAGEQTHDKTITALTELSKKANDLSTEIKAYKYYLLWYNK